MESQQDILKQIQILEENEEALAGLYQAYANRFPEYEEFWFGLAMQEIDHSNLIHELIQRVKRGEARLYEHTLDIVYLQNFKELIDRETDRANYESISHHEALSTALRVEKDIIEHKYAQIFDSDSEEIRRILDEMTIATKRHRKLLEEHLDMLQ
jgi:rubrerythrin